MVVIEDMTDILRYRKCMNNIHGVFLLEFDHIEFACDFNFSGALKSDFVGKCGGELGYVE